MANYIWSSENRFYVALEMTYGTPAAIQPSNRLQAARLQCHQSVQQPQRRDKTGSRTYLGSAPTAPRVSSFEISMNLTSWDQVTAPCYGPFVEAVMGASPVLTRGLIVSAVDGAQLSTQAPHGLSVGTGIASGGEVRFVTAVPDSSTAVVNVPFVMAPNSGDTIDATISYAFGTQLASLSLYDYWDPSTSVSRLLTGAGADSLQIDVKGDVHELIFSGPAADILDSSSGVYGVSGISLFPSEPALSTFEYSVVPGELGEVWLGAPLNQVFTLTSAAIEIRNNILTRGSEIGSSYPMAIVPGPREVLSNFTLFAQADANTAALYTAAKSRMPISAMLQLGKQGGQIMSIYLPSVVPELPFYDDSEPYLLWEFKNDLAQGVTNDEAYIAFA